MISITTALLLLVITVASAIICHTIAKRRGNKPTFWGVMGALFGPLVIPFIYLSGKGDNDDR